SGDLPARSATGSAAGGEQAVTWGRGGIRGLTSSGSPVVSDHRGAPGSLWRCVNLLLCHCGGIGGSAGGWGSVVSAAGLSERAQHSSLGRAPLLMSEGGGGVSAFGQVRVGGMAALLREQDGRSRLVRSRGRR